MSATTYESTTASGRDSRPGLGRLIRVELRKMHDTRAGFWLLLTAVLLAGLAAALTILTGSDNGRNFSNALDNSTQAINFLVPIVGILLVTSEWSQRTAQTTFTLVPKRDRVLIAKIGASILLALAAFAVTIVLSAVFTAIGGKESIDTGLGTWEIDGGVLAQVALFNVISMLIGVGLGAAILLSAPAIVAAFVLPVGVSLICELISSLNDTANWIGQGEALSPLTDHALSGTEWGRVVTATLIWAVLPLTIGLWRFVKSEVR
ncbi:ABC transporter permease [Baekduia sp. Peel2402]|uniref:ABC transporter permease n=1 Tax=Baekduia sp. Peel2402 TaxID=3458296 RepID=UPI00403ECFB8